MSHKNRIYTSDLTDEQWELIKPLLPLEQKGPGRPLELDMRAVLNGIFYLNRTGCRWADIPKEYPAPSSISYHYNKWKKDGTWQAINEALRIKERERVGRKSEPTAGGVLIAKASKQPLFPAFEAMMPAKKSKVVNVISLLIPSAICLR